MNASGRRGLVLALTISLLIHLAAVSSPAWLVGDWMQEPPVTLEAHLSVPRPGAPPHPPPAAKPRPSRPPAVEPAPVPAPLAQEGPPVEPSPVPVPPEPETAPTPPPPLEAPPPEVAPLLPRRGWIQFLISRGDGGLIIGRSIHEWSHDGKRYRLTATSQTTGLAALFKPVKAVQASEGTFVQAELKPATFRYEYGDGVVESAAFDWDAGQVRLGNGQNFGIGEGAEDILSMFYQLIKAAQRGEGFVMAVTTGKKLERYVFDWLDEETLDLKPGRFRAWHVRVRSASGGADVTDVWLGREVAGLPIRIRFTDRKGEVFDQRADEIDYEGK